MMGSCGAASSGRKRWLTLLGGMSELSSSLEHGGCQMLGLRAEGCSLPNTRANVRMRRHEKRERDNSK
jgi:hypothetical protein